MDRSFTPNSGANGPVLAIGEQDDGSLIIGGAFTAWDGVARSGLVRLRPNGDLDQSFNPQFTSSDPVSVNALSVQANGALLIGGSFNSVNGTVHPALVRLTRDGAVDPSHISPFQVTSVVRDLLLSPAGLFVAGNFQRVGGLARPAVVRLTATGAVDLSYGPLLPSFEFPFDPFLPNQPDGFALILDGQQRLVLAADWLSGATIGQINLSNPSRFSVSGALDLPFQPRSPASQIRCLAAGTNDTLWVGDFSLRRLREDGTYDSTFAPIFTRTSGATSSIRRLLTESDGKIIVGGQFDRINGNPRAHLARLFPDGTIDTRFAATSALNGPVFALARDANGRLLIGGDFSQIEGTPRARLARLLNPALPPRIQTPPAAVTVTAGTNTRLAVTTDPDPGLTYRWLRNGEPLAGETAPELYLVNVTAPADFSVEVSNAAGVARSPTVRLAVTPRQAGGIDPAFNAIAPPPGVVPPFPPVAFGAGGRFYLKTGNNVVRVNSDLIVDPTFSLGLVPNAQVGVDGVELEDGRLLLRIDGALQRYLSDGKIDSSFSLRGFTSASTTGFRLLTNGQIMMVGSFTSGSVRRYLARVSADGVSDPSFQPPVVTPSNDFNRFIVQSDGKILTASFIILPSSQIQRLLPDGALDPTWTPLMEPFDILADDGGLYRSDDFIGEMRRIREDGSVDPTFRCKVSTVEIRASGVKFERAVRPDIAALRDGRLLLTGGFNSINNIPVQGLALIDRQGVLDPTFGVPSSVSPSYRFLRQSGEFLYILYDYVGQFGRTPARFARLFLEGGGLPRMVNLATRAYAGTGNRAVVAGFVLRGAPAQPILVRGLGPTLASFGLANPLAAPRLELFQGSTSIATNLAWSANAASLNAAATRVGAFTLAASSADTGLFAALAEGNYTAEIRPQSGAEGTALAEVYAEGTLPGAELVNLATRAEVRPESPVVAGFTLRGSGMQQVLIRAIGPALSAFGVPGTMPNPKLRVLRGGEVRAVNDDWSLDPNAGFAASAALQVGAFTLPTGSRDAALLLTLEAGAYTAIVESADGAGGIALVEVYAVAR